MNARKPLLQLEIAGDVYATFGVGRWSGPVESTRLRLIQLESNFYVEADRELTASNNLRRTRDLGEWIVAQIGSGVVLE